jgi:hypothetical protein
METRSRWSDCRIIVGSGAIKNPEESSAFISTAVAETD